MASACWLTALEGQQGLVPGTGWHEALREAGGTQEGGDLREGTGLREMRAQRRQPQWEQGLWQGSASQKGARLGALRGGLGGGS